MASNNVDLAWTSSSGSSQTTVYSENTNAMNGHTVYVKDFSVNTGNQILDRAMSNRPVKSHLKGMMVGIWFLMRAC